MGAGVAIPLPGLVVVVAGAVVVTNVLVGFTVVAVTTTGGSPEVSTQ